MGQLLMIVGSLIGVRVLTELMPPSVYGELALGMTIATLVNQTIIGPLSGGFIRFYAPAAERCELPEYLMAAKKLMLYATTLIILLIALFTAVLIVKERMEWVAITISALVFAILNGYGASLSSILTAARQRSVVALHQGFDSLLRALIAGCFLLLIGVSSSVAMLGYIVATVLLLGSQFFFFRVKISTNIYVTSKTKSVSNWQRDIWRFSWPIGTFGIFTWMQLASDRWALQAFSTMQDVGNYTVLYQLGYFPMSLIAGMVMQFIIPILYQRAGNAEDCRRNAEVTSLSWKVTWLCLGITGVAFIISILWHAEIFKIFVAKEYAQVSFLLPWVIIAGGIFASGQSVASILLSQLKTREMIRSKIITALFGVAFNILGAYLYGIKGVVVGGVAFALISFFWTLSLVNRMDKKQEFNA